MLFRSVQALRGALEAYAKEGGPPNYQVLVFTFDATDTAADLQAFRLNQKIPPSWKIVRSPDQGAIRSFFDQFSYSIMSSGGGFTHPNEVFAFNKNSIWISSLFGSKLTGGEIKSLFKTILDSEKRDPWSEISNWLASPENWVIFGTVGFLASLIAVFAVLFRKRERVLITKADP